MATAHVANAEHPVPPQVKLGSTVAVNGVLSDVEVPNGIATHPYPYPKSNISLEDRFIDEPRTLRVAVIGGGLAGVLAGILLPVKVPGIDLVIYEKNNDVVSLSEPTTLSSAD
jgi:hypothetical protein